ncbi:MAG: DNA polymerase I [Candidatus Komeilibacteria bacterium]|nr:DNA polymerase I [Candidatus Komeilibacteria bacterium]
MTKNLKKFVIIDGNALLHRAWHALPPMTLKDGTMVHAVYGFTSILLKIIKDLKPDYICAAFDRKGPSKRAAAFAAYKAQRVKKPDELYAQIPLIEQVLAVFNIPVVDAQEAGYEADDVIGAIIAKLKKEEPGLKKIIVTGDLDTLQLVDEHTEVFTLKKGISETFSYNEQAVKERYGLLPEQLIDFKALRGDPSDNIPGVKGIGEKTAAELIQKYQTLAGLYEKLADADIKPRVKELLQNQQKEAELSKDLVTIQTDLKTNFELEQAKMSGFNEDQVFELFQKFEFKSLLNKIPSAMNGQSTDTEKTVEETEVLAKEQAKNKASQSAFSFVSFKPKQNAADFDYQLVKDDSGFNQFLKKLAEQKEFAIDSETTAINVWQAELLGLSFSWKNNEGYYLDIKNNKSWLKKLQPILENPAIKKVGHNLKYDYEMLLQNNIKLEGLECDTMLAAYLLSSGSRNLDLDSLVFAEVGHQMQPITDLIGPKGKNQLNMADVPLEQVSWYAAEDADFTLQLKHKLMPQLAEADNAGLLTKIELPLVPVLADMEQAGIKIDKLFLKKLDQSLTAKIKDIETRAYQMAGQEFNIASPLQLKEILFEKLKIEVKGLKKIKTGLSTAAGELEKMKDRHPIIPLISEFREYSKLQNTYTQTLPEQTDKFDRIHSNFNQTIAATGRLSSSDPNLQNIPIRTDLGKEIRKAFVAEKGNVLLSADYSQIELRVIASLADDEKMIESFNKGEDIHARTAANINKIDITAVTPKQRRAAKEVNFGVIYGLGFVGLAQRTGISRDEAKDFIARYFELYPQIKNWLDATKEQAAAQGFVETLLGRRRYLPDIHSGAQMIKAGAERMAVNAPIQGSAADLLKMAMIKIHEQLPNVSKTAKMLLTVHDELVFEVKENEAEIVAAFIKEQMEGIYTLKVPIKVDIGIGHNWDECK